ncbi:MAG: DUF1254 domain-containing protein [Alphaproteobacteria bacterium]|nr:DUF1254 domain-containing protein [Alphaproteobacteria bacterium]
MTDTAAPVRLAWHRRHVLAAAAGGAALAAAPSWAAAPGDAALAAAFDYAYPLFEFSRAMQRIGERAKPGTPLAERLNQIFHRRVLADHTARQVTAPNNDTIYSSCFMDLSGGPMILGVPDVPDRYFSVSLMNAFTDNFAMIGTRATGGKGGTFWIAGPDWQGTVPAGARLIRSETNDIWMLIRILVTGPTDLPAVHKVQDGFSLAPAPGRGPVRPLAVRAVNGEDAAQVLDAAAEMLSRSPDSVGPARRWRRFAEAGVRPAPGGVFATLPPALQARWRAAVPGLVAGLRASFTAAVRQVKGWAASTGEVGVFGDNDHLRAAVALSGLAALPPEEARYFSSVRDNDRRPLEPGSRYRIRIPAAGVPVDGFWSVTMYAAEPDGRYFFVENPIGRYAVSDRTPGLVRRADGSIDILMSRERPAEPDVNWLPMPDGPMRISFRCYLPQAPIRDGRWTPPPIERLS